MKKLYIITDRDINHSESIARYVIDLASALTAYFDVTVYTTNESTKVNWNNKKNNTKFPFKLANQLPSAKDDAIFHFHLTFSIRKHVKYLIKNIEELKQKTVVTFHVDPQCAIAMKQKKNVNKILKPLIDKDILIYVFSNYSKTLFEQYNVKKIWVLYPGLDLSIYDKFKSISKKDQILFIVSSPENQFVNKIKGGNLLPEVKKLLNSKYKVVVKNNLHFDEYLNLLAQSKFYLALGEYEHYGFSIIDAFNLGAIPIYNNKGGLTEAVDGRGFPLFIYKKKALNWDRKEFNYDIGLVSNNYASSQIIHDIKHHIQGVMKIYKLI